MIDAQALLQPITADQLCGEDVEYTLLPAFDAFRVFGQATTPDPQPDWGEIHTKALDGLRKSKDLRLLAHLGTAALRTDGITDFASTLIVASEWLEAHWSHVYPLVDGDALQRRNALNCFADPIAVVEAIRRVPLVSSRQHGTITLRDIDLATGQMQPVDGESRVEEAQIDAAFGAMPIDELTALEQSVAGALAALTRIDGTMATQGGPEAKPYFDRLSAQLTKADRVLRAQLSARQPAGSGLEGDSADLDDGGGVQAVGRIRSREDAIRALDAVAEFFRRNEPSSPVPMFIERAKRLVSKSFLEVLADIAPDGLAQARVIGGVSDSE
jgi:type VI secretion system protein ImpA